MTKRFPLTLLASFGMASVGVGATSCTTEPAPARPAPPSSTTTAAQNAPSAPKPTGSTFGKALDLDTPFVSLAEIQKDPKAWQGKRVRTRGEIVAVCQAAGCWCDLKPVAEPGVAAVAAIVPTHVTMHDHAFLLPKTSKSKLAEIEGNLVVRELSQQEVDHYNGEGASLTTGAPVINVDAVGVILR